MRFPIRRTSTAIKQLIVNPITGTARVTFTTSGRQYRFTGVSRRAIAAAIIARPASVGQWVNCHCWA